MRYLLLGLAAVFLVMGYPPQDAGLAIVACVYCYMAGANFLAVAK